MMCLSLQGHDGVVIDGKIVNDLTVVQLQRQAICHARAGADIVAPSGILYYTILCCSMLFYYAMLCNAFLFYVLFNDMMHL